MRIFELPCAFVSVSEQQKFCCVNVSARAPRVCAFHNYISEPERAAPPCAQRKTAIPHSIVELPWNALGIPLAPLSSPVWETVLSVQKEMPREELLGPSERLVVGWGEGHISLLHAQQDSQFPLAKAWGREETREKFNLEQDQVGNKRHGFPHPLGTNVVPVLNCD